jgi:hypothetical protein
MGATGTSPIAWPPAISNVDACRHYIEMEPSLKSVRSSQTLTSAGPPAFAAARARASTSGTSAVFDTTLAKNARAAPQSTGAGIK